MSSTKVGHIQRNLDSQQWKRVEGAMSTLNTSHYVLVGEKRAQRQGVVALVENAESWKESYESLYQEYSKIFDVAKDYEKRVIELRDVLAEVCEHGESVANKLKLIETIVNSKNSSSAVIEITNPKDQKQESRVLNLKQ
jgi:capsular polysaccharide biosynthesis protein